MAEATHIYRTRVDWSGSTGAGYEHYDRNHRASCIPASTQVGLSSDPSFRGDPTRLNPEQLLVLAASSCQLLSFLSVAARARLDVVDYADEAVGEMPEDDPPTRITRIVLRPEITLSATTFDGSDTAIAKVTRLIRLAHDECYIANSLRTEIVVEPTLRSR